MVIDPQYRKLPTQQHTEYADRERNVMVKTKLGRLHVVCVISHKHFSGLTILYLLYFTPSDKTLI